MPEFTNDSAMICDDGVWRQAGAVANPPPTVHAIGVPIPAITACESPAEELLDAA